MRIRTNRMMDGTPAVIQPPVNGFPMSYNPDDGHWYIHHPKTDETLAHYAHRRNAIAWARTRLIFNFN